VVENDIAVDRSNNTDSWLVLTLLLAAWALSAAVVMALGGFTGKDPIPLSTASPGSSNRTGCASR
jgi:hypothetical protein